VKACVGISHGTILSCGLNAAKLNPCFEELKIVIKQLQKNRNKKDNKEWIKLS